MSCRAARLARTLLAAATLAAAPASARAASLVVYLPEAPVENANSVAAGAAALAKELATAVPGLEAKVFRRYDDANAYVAANPSQVALLLVDHGFLLDLPSSLPVENAWRMVRGGRETYHKLLVVRADARPQSLDDLRGKSLSVAQTMGFSGTLYLEKLVFRGQLALGSWFGRIEPVADDLSAAANVLYGTTDAGLVSADNPLVEARLGRELRAVYTSPELSLPVLAIRRGALDDAQRRALDALLPRLGTRPGGAAALTGLKAEAFRPLRERLLERADLLQTVSTVERPLALAVPPARDLDLGPAPKPDGSSAVYVLGVELPDLPPPAP